MLQLGVVSLLIFFPPTVKNWEMLDKENHWENLTASTVSEINVPNCTYHCHICTFSMYLGCTWCTFDLSFEYR